MKMENANEAGECPMKLSEKIQEAVAAVESRYVKVGLPLTLPRTAIILGSGLGSFAASIHEHLAIPFGEIPHCSAARVPGHQGRFIIGELAGETIVCMQGRLHTYEGNTPLETTFPLLVAHALGARRLIVTNAAGAINKAFAAGDLMLILDHINYTGVSPVGFDEDNDLVTTFFDITHAYTPALCERARAAAEALGITLREGVYLGLRGPAFETPAEIRAFRCWGADAVGMSTIHEVIMAAALQMEVCGISLLSNMAAGILDKPITNEEVIETAALHLNDFARLVTMIVNPSC